MSTRFAYKGGENNTQVLKRVGSTLQYLKMMLQKHPQKTQTKILQRNALVSVALEFGFFLVLFMTYHSK